MNLQEQTNRIKKIMGLKEQNYRYQIEPAKSDYLGRGGDFERQQFGGASKETYLKLLKTTSPKKIKKVRLIFPQEGWEERALQWLKKIGLVTGIYNSINSAISFIKDLSNKNVKTDELVIGSHGGGGNLLTTKDEGRYNFNNSFLDSMRDIVHPKTKVFFTACYGADFLDGLKDASERLGVGVYGSSGVYNYVTNTSENGFYYCSSKSFQKPLSKMKINGIKKINNGFINVFIPISEEQFNNLEKIKYYIIIKNGVFSENIPELVGVSTIQKTLGRFDMSGSQFRKKEYMQEFILNIIGLISDYANKTQNQTKNNFYNDMNAKLIKQKRGNISTYIDSKINSGEIKIKVETYKGMIDDVLQIKPFNFTVDIDNEFLLKNKLCQKVSSSPISWVDSLLN